MTEDNNNETHSLGEINPILAIDIIVFIVCLIGLTLNLVLLYLTSLCKRPKAIDFVLILIISVFDSLLCFTVIFTLIYRWCQGSSVLSDSSLWCILNSIISNPSFLCTLLGTAMLSLARYFALVRKYELCDVNWIASSLSLVVLIWIIYSYRSITNQLVIFPSGLYCIPIMYGKDWQTKVFGYMVQLILYPATIVIPICYSLIILHYRRQFSHKFTPFLHCATFPLMLTVIAYSLCIFPDYILLLLSHIFKINRTTLSDGILSIFSFTVTIVNAIFALFMHEEINEDFRSLLGYGSSGNPFAAIC